jgi:methylglutaconyl-CoA hydratase
MQKQTVELSGGEAITTVTLSRPDFHNALNDQLINDLTSTFREISDNGDIRVVILTGEGRSFCAGADLLSLGQKPTEKAAEIRQAEAEAIFDLMMMLNNCPIPVVGRVNGAAVGGGMGLVSCCDIVVSVDTAKFGFSEVRLGLVPAVISPFVISKIGHSRARELFLTAERFDAESAMKMGLVHKVVSEHELDASVMSYIQQLLKGAPGAQSDAKRLIRDVSANQAEDMREFTTELFASRLLSDEGTEGIDAFLERRIPKWRL